MASDRFGPRRVLLVGAAALGIGLVVTSQAGSLLVALVGYGLGVGIGVACAYVPMVALVGGWFERRRTLALGVAVAGIGVGTLALPPATAALIEEIGWRDTYLVLAALGVATLLVCAVARRPGARRRGGRRDPAGRGGPRSRLPPPVRSRRCSSPSRCSSRSCTSRRTRRSAASTPCPPPG